MDWLTTLPFLPGEPPDASAPLARYLPPIPRGPARDFLAGRIPPGSWVLDPFGSSSTLACEAARAGYRVLVAANNPVSRFLIDLAAAPPSLSDFQAALAELSLSRKENEPLEKHLQSLYLTECPGCRRSISAEAFVWEKRSGVLMGRMLTCSHCGAQGEYPATPADAERAARWAHAEAMHRARALERIAPRNDPDREYAAEALDIYPPRAIYAVWTLINRLDQLNLIPPRRRALTALLLAVCDSASGLWPHPAERPRPRQLTLPSQFRENNVWLALENAISAWALPTAEAPLPVTTWPNMPPETGGVCLFEGALRDLTPQLSNTPISAIVTAIPRPNQAFWTLSALWAGWLWGREATTSFKSVLRRRRYDWQWHTEALTAAFGSLVSILPPQAPCFALLTEPEAPFISAVFGAAQAAGLRLSGLAMRTASDPIQCVWEKFPAGQPPASKPAAGRIAHAAIQFVLQARGEALTHLHLHLAAAAALAQESALPSGSDSVSETGGITLRALEAPEFTRYEGKTSPESGLWGLAAPPEQPFADRVEMLVVRFLQKNPGASLAELTRALYHDLPGLLTPPQALLQAVLESYAVERGGWYLREEDSPAARRSELTAMRSLVQNIGRRLGYAVSAPADAPVTWADAEQPAYILHVSASALMGKVAAAPPVAGVQTVLVIPGGRAGLIAYKRKRDPALRAASQEWHFLKYRHLRQIADLPLLTPETWPELLRSDPIEQQGGQMMLF